MAQSYESQWWVSESFWRKCAIFVTAGMALVLVFLTFHTLYAIGAGSDAGRVPAYSVINYRIDYVPSEERGHLVPEIGPMVPLFGEVMSEEDAKALVNHGKLTVQARNCMNCHTLLGNGAYYAPDLTKAWLDPGWGNEQARELLMTMFLKDPVANARTFGTNRRMPNQNLTDDEVRGVIAYLKWMSAIDTNGFPANFTTLPQDGPVYEPETAASEEDAS
ncbi:MAG: cytochrome c [Gammaproteobacteria bacterium]|nr:cytochrome c [Gammaproteobacteria bacterium]